MRNPQNTSSKLEIENELFIETLSHHVIKIDYSDANGDDVFITSENLHELASIIKRGELYFLQLSTRYISEFIIICEQTLVNIDLLPYSGKSCKLTFNEHLLGQSYQNIT